MARPYVTQGTLRNIWCLSPESGTLLGMADADPTTPTAPTALPPDQRALAARLFNRTWELLEASRDAAGDREMLASALASRLHWEGIGTDENLAAGDWLVAHVASHLGYADLALDFATAAHERASAADPPVPLLAARLDPGGPGPGARRRRATTTSGTAGRPMPGATLTGVDDDEDRELIESQLDTVPGLDARADAGPGHEQDTMVR